MAKPLRSLQRSEAPRKRARLGAALTGALVVIGACTTEDPREHFRSVTSGVPTGSGGSTTGTAGSSTNGQAGTGRAGREGAPEAGTAGSGGRSNTDSAAGEAGEDSRGGSSSAGRTQGTAGDSGAGGRGGSAGSGASSGSDGGPVNSCGEPPVTNEPFTKQALRTAAADCAVWHYCKFEAEAARLEATIATEIAEPTPETREAAQNAWRSAMGAWSRVELFQFGPLASRAESEGKDIVYGQGLREFIYSWPRFTRCRVEEQVATERYATQGFENVPIAARGLYGIEYLLFYGGSDTACTTGTTATTWPTLAASELDARKHRYLAALSGDMLGTTRKLIELWSPSGGNFRSTFVSATGYEDEQQALTILAWSLVYLEREVKDWKLGVPLGITLTHPVNGPEAPFSHVATENIRHNLRGFRALFQGCGPSGEGLGFDDWLSEAGHAELGADIVAALDAADSFANAFGPLDTATESELAAFYAKIKAVTDYLKSDLFGPGSPLNLKLPMGVQGDTD